MFTYEILYHSLCLQLLNTLRTAAQSSSSISAGLATMEQYRLLAPALPEHNVHTVSICNFFNKKWMSQRAVYTLPSSLQVEPPLACWPAEKPSGTTISALTQAATDR